MGVLLVWSYPCPLFDTRRASLDFFFLSLLPRFYWIPMWWLDLFPSGPSFRSTCCSLDVSGQNDTTTWRYASNDATDAWKAAVVALKVEHLVWDVEAMRAGLSMGQLDTVKAYLLEQLSRIDEAKVMYKGVSHYNFALTDALRVLFSQICTARLCKLPILERWRGSFDESNPSPSPRKVGIHFPAHSDASVRGWKGRFNRSTTQTTEVG